MQCAYFRKPFFTYFLISQVKNVSTIRYLATVNLHALFADAKVLILYYKLSWQMMKPLLYMLHLPSSPQPGKQSKLPSQCATPWFIQFNRVNSSIKYVTSGSFMKYCSKLSQVLTPCTMAIYSTNRTYKKIGRILYFLLHAGCQPSHWAQAPLLERTPGSASSLYPAPVALLPHKLCMCAHRKLVKS
jgi:hypothetical protein